MNNVEKPNPLTARTHIHSWYIPREQSDINRLLNYCLLLTAFSLPLEGLLPHYFGMRTHVFYLFIIASGLSALRFPDMLNSLSQSKGLRLLIATFLWTSILYYINPVRPNREPILLLQLIIMAIVFLNVAQDKIWRERILWAYWLGWLVFLILSLNYYASGQAKIVRYVLIDAERVYSVLGLSAAQHAYHVGTGVVLSLMLLVNRKRNLLGSSFMIAVIAVGSIVLLMTSTRGGVVALFITMVIWIAIQAMTKQRDRQFIRTTLLILSATLASYTALTQTSFGQEFLDTSLKRFNQATEDKNFSGRQTLTENSLRSFYSNPVGIGQGNAQYALGLWRTHRTTPGTHNHYLRVMVEGGVFGIALFLSGLIQILKYGYKRVENQVFFYPFIYLLVSALFVEPFHYKLLWFFVAMNAISLLQGTPHENS